MGKLKIYSERSPKLIVRAMTALAPVAVGPLVVIYGNDLITNPYVQSVGIGLFLYGIYLLRKRRVGNKEKPEARMEVRMNNQSVRH